MTIDYNFDLATGRQLGTTPGDLYITLRAAGVPITGFTAKFSQPNPLDNYVLTGDKIQVTAQQIETEGMAVVRGSITITGNPEVSEDFIKNAILRFCLGSSVGMAPK